MQNLLINSIERLIQSNILLIILIFLVLICIWLIIRELLTWYWKINDIVRLLEKIETGVDFLATNADQNNKKNIFEKKTIIDNNSKKT